MFDLLSELLFLVTNARPKEFKEHNTQPKKTTNWIK